MDLIWQWGLDLIRTIQLVATPELDAVFTGITSLGNEMFFLLLVPLVLWCVDYSVGHCHSHLFGRHYGVACARTAFPSYGLLAQSAIELTLVQTEQLMETPGIRMRQLTHGSQFLHLIIRKTEVQCFHAVFVLLRF